MSKSPAFQFYPSHWLSSLRVHTMTLEEEGAYIRLLCFCWLHGSVPNDTEKIARIIGKGGSTVVARVVQAMFTEHPHDTSLLIHDRLEEERAKQAEWREKSAAGGRKSAETRKKRKNELLESSTVVEPHLQGWLQNGVNQKPTLMSYSSSLSLSLDKNIVEQSQTMPETVVEPPLKEPPTKKTRRKKEPFIAPTLDEVKAYFKEKGTTIDAEHFHASYESVGWKKKNGQQIENWKACLVTWEKNQKTWSIESNGRSNAEPVIPFRTGERLEIDPSYYE